jgi:hypothetical protein
MRHIISIAFIVLSASSCEQTKNHEIETILLDCLSQRYQEKKIDLNQELEDLENHLIERKTLKSTSGQSYFDFFTEIVKRNDIPVTLDHKRFENIYKLQPSEFYKVDCLEKLKGIDTAIIAASKYNQMSVAIQKAAEDEVSPSNIARAITSVLSPSDFDNPYYRAIALLTIAFTAERDSVIIRKIMPTDNEDLSSCEVITVLTTGKNQIILNGNFVNEEDLKSTLSGFIKTNKSNHLIKFEADQKTSYNFYLKVQEGISSVYNDLRDEWAKEKYNKSYNELNEDEQKEMREVYPFRVKE